jgi:AraC-like DNA-binding protein
MLLARGHVKVGEGSLRWSAAFAPRFWMSINEHRGLTIDASIIPPSQQPSNDGACLYILVAGTWRIQNGPSFEGPCALVTSQAHIEGANGVRPLIHRAEGTPLSMVQIYVSAAHTTQRARDLPFPIELDAQTWDAARLVLARSQESDRDLEEAVTALMARLSGRFLAGDDIVGTARLVDAPLRLLWKGVRPIVERLDLLGRVKEVCAAIGVTPREFDRYARLFLSSFGVVGAGWREVARHFRLKLAIIFLSAEGVTVSEVSRVVGYGSADAMTRAFRDEGLPSPSALRAQFSGQPPTA